MLAKNKKNNHFDKFLHLITIFQQTIHIKRSSWF